MTSPRVWKRGFVMTGAVMVVAIWTTLGTAHADVVFRKKAPAASSGEASPTGGEPGTEETPAAVPTAPQLEDKDYPELQAEKDQKAADAVLARDARKAQQERDREKGDPLYKKWQFWAITGAVVVGAVLAVWGGSAVWHQIRGGDVSACNPSTTNDGCFGAGR